MGDSYRPSRSGDQGYHDNNNNNSRGRRGSISSRSRSPPRRREPTNQYARRREPFYGQQVFDPSPYFNQYGQLSHRQDYHQNPPRGYGRRQSFGREQHMMYDEPAEPPAYHGEKDAAKDDNMPWKVLLVLDLRHNVTEELLSRGLEKLYREQETEAGAKPKSLKRVMLIRDRKSDESMRFGFAEYHTVEDAQQALKKAKAMEAEYQLTIASSYIHVCFPHAGVFPHDTADGKPERNPKFKFKLFSEAEHKYHDRRYYASFHDVNLESPYPALDLEKQQSDADKGSVSKEKKKAAVSLDGFSRKRKAPGTAPAGPAIPSQWTKAQAELRGEDEDATASRDATTQPATGVNAIASAIKPTATDANNSEQTFVHGDETSGFGCYLCASRFNQMEGVVVHLQQSTKHANRVRDEKRIETAFDLMKAKAIDPSTTLKLPPQPSQEVQQESRPQFRDRAAERRAEEAKTNATTPGSAPKVGFSLKKKKGGDAASSPPSSGNESGGKSKPTYGKGLDMLAKQGYVEGQGLGSSGDGVAAPIEMNIYASGVGLGHEESKKGDAVEEAEKATRGEGKGYAEAGKERLYERYNQL